MLLFQCSASGDPMSYTGRGGNFGNLQMMQIYNMARNGLPNRGDNCGIMGTYFPDASFGTFYGTTTNERPFPVALDKRAKIPFPVPNSDK